MPSDPGQLRIRNQRYPRRVVVAENVLVGGLLVSFVVIEILGLWLLGTRTTVCVLLACHLAISPVVIRGWLLIWDLNRAGPPRRGVTARALYEGVFLGIGRKELPAAIGWTALTWVRAWLPSVHTVARLKLGDEVEAYAAVRFSTGAVRRVRFAPDPDEDYRESEPPLLLCEATVEVHSGRRFRLTVTEADAQRLRDWAVAKGIAVCESEGYRPRPAETASEV
jgi:hypothetical protein